MCAQLAAWGAAQRPPVPPASLHLYVDGARVAEGGDHDHVSFATVESTGLFGATVTAGAAAEVVVAAMRAGEQGQEDPRTQGRGQKEAAAGEAAGPRVEAEAGAAGAGAGAGVHLHAGAGYNAGAATAAAAEAGAAEAGAAAAAAAEAGAAGAAEEARILLAPDLRKHLMRVVFAEEWAESITASHPAGPHTPGPRLRTVSSYWNGTELLRPPCTRPITVRSKCTCTSLPLPPPPPCISPTSRSLHGVAFTGAGVRPGRRRRQICTGTQVHREQTFGLSGAAKGGVRPCHPDTPARATALGTHWREVDIIIRALAGKYPAGLDLIARVAAGGSEEEKAALGVTWF